MLKKNILADVEKRRNDYLETKRMLDCAIGRLPDSMYGVAGDAVESESEDSDGNVEGYTVYEWYDIMLHRFTRDFQRYELAVNRAEFEQEKSEWLYQLDFLE